MIAMIDKITNTIALSYIRDINSYGRLLLDFVLAKIIISFFCILYQSLC